MGVMDATGSTVGGSSSRRQFLAVAAATCACAVGCPLAEAQDARDADVATVDIGTAADYLEDGAYDAFARKPHSLIVVRGGGRLYAMTAVCTHKKKQLKVEEGEIVCTAHDSPFDYQGVPRPKTKEGDDTPAKEPLDRFAIARDSEGRLTVDKSKRFTKGKWDDPASFVKLEGQA